MSLNPSNLIAARTNPGRTMFRDLARRVPEDNSAEAAQIHEEVDTACRAELEAAGIKCEGFEPLRRSNGEVPTKFLGSLCLWGFHRAWYYWIAEGPGIPLRWAEEFHQIWGTQCRVGGHCGCPSPLEHYRGFAVGKYHIDTQEGLNAFAALLRRIHRPREVASS